MRLILFFVLALIFSPFASQAGEIVGCGVPASVTIETDPGFTYCDIYQRQLAYRDEAIKLDRQMKARQINFAAPRIEALKRYQADMEVLNEQRDYEQARAAP